MNISNGLVIDNNRKSVGLGSWTDDIKNSRFQLNRLQFIADLKLKIEILHINVDGILYQQLVCDDHVLLTTLLLTYHRH